MCQNDFFFFFFFFEQLRVVPEMWSKERDTRKLQNFEYNPQTRKSFSFSLPLSSLKILTAWAGRGQLSRELSHKNMMEQEEKLLDLTWEQK